MILVAFCLLHLFLNEQVYQPASQPTSQQAIKQAHPTIEILGTDGNWLGCVLVHEWTHAALNCNNFQWSIKTLFQHTHTRFGCTANRHNETRNLIWFSNLNNPLLSKKTTTLAQPSHTLTPPHPKPTPPVIVRTRRGVNVDFKAASVMEPHNVLSHICLKWGKTEEMKKNDGILE